VGNEGRGGGTSFLGEKNRGAKKGVEKGGGEVKERQNPWIETTLRRGEGVTSYGIKVGTVFQNSYARARTRKNSFNLKTK